VRVALIGLIAAGLAWIFVPREYRAAVVGYQTTDDARTIVVQATLGPGDTLLGSDVLEDTTRVVVMVKARDTGTTEGPEGDTYFITITLKEPLGGRALISGSDLRGQAGQAIPQRP
jgi:hypothetical protein